MHHQITPYSVFGSLTVLRTNPNRSTAKRRYYLCRCKCGNLKTVYRSNLISGTTNSCGCERPARISASKTVHGYSSWPEFGVWAKMKRRCEQPDDESYDRYGGRGISVCAEWAESFTAFISDMGRRPSPRHQIERTDNDGDYTPANCVWATPAAQARNRRSTRLLTHGGITLCLTDWARRLGIKRETLAYRLNSGYDFPSAISKGVGDGEGQGR